MVTDQDIKLGLRFVSGGASKTEYEIVSLKPKSLTVRRLSDGKEITMPRKKIFSLIERVV
jgi:hypothetical protein